MSIERGSAICVFTPIVSSALLVESEICKAVRMDSSPSLTVVRALHAQNPLKPDSSLPFRGLGDSLGITTLPLAQEPHLLLAASVEQTGGSVAAPKAKLHKSEKSSSELFPKDLAANACKVFG